MAFVLDKNLSRIVDSFILSFVNIQGKLMNAINAIQWTTQY